MNKSRSIAILAILGNASQVYLGLKDDSEIVDEIIKYSPSELQNMGAVKIFTIKKICFYDINFYINFITAILEC